ncbi:biotin--[acetyl-CoA-carboxylase] ligase [Rhodospirillum rubrum]|uniref:biotin--[acetyl-CoA-carboxylase] ligase n=1 Tax=Rhodospirillum rubrum TaxID=1085 RepID=UPI001902D36D|nr:biotin--[acetyl-CoA-carboxylase] ligase [Rhodospirillum rubrum]MBK1663311.1 biotin--[acetyl-CoA-carboxylase] ligase [Rhodospirillum rubrum]MBK1675122.1 biotin--[acetyl-CoA-carboxylase] ligase [Rhodospirillum rubrum]
MALPVVESTNLTARALFGAAPAKDLAGLDRTVVWAGEQSGGRGRQARVWHSPPGNLYHSYLLRSPKPVGQCAQLSFVAAVALAEAVERLCPLADPRCKWPNDIVCHGGKISGMLLELIEEGEGGDPWLVLGIGVNIITAPVTGALFPALALADLGCAVTIEEMLGAIAARLDHWLVRWQDEGFTGVRAAWIARALGIGLPIEVRLSEETRLPGVFQGLDAEGHLMLEDPLGRVRRISAGDVFFPGR